MLLVLPCSRVKCYIKHIYGINDIKDGICILMPLVWQQKWHLAYENPAPATSKVFHIEAGEGLLLTSGTSYI